MKLSELLGFSKSKETFEARLELCRNDFQKALKLFFEEIKNSSERLDIRCSRCGSSEVYKTWGNSYICTDCGWCVIDFCGGDDMTEDEERKLIAEAQFKEADSYINQMDKIYICPECSSQDLRGYPWDSGRKTLLKCNTCGNNWTPDYLEEHNCCAVRVDSNDVVNHPEHYISQDGIESIDVIKAFTRDLVGMESVCTANILKYTMRWKRKNGVEDLKKARWYLNYLIDSIEGENDE